MSKRQQRRDRPLPQRSAERRLRTKHGFELQVFEGPELGAGIVAADRATVMAALDDFDPDAPWEVARHKLIPLLPRVRPLPVPIDGLVQAMVPPGVLTGFGLDLGPAVTFLDHARLVQWGIRIETVISTALANVRRLVATCRPETVVHGSIDGVPIAAFQSGLGIASTLILVPECIEALLGRGQHLLLAPIRDLLLALPAATDPRLVRWISAEYEALDPNCLHLGAFHHEGVTISAVSLDEAVARA
ncbi:MAG: hypothetical protein ACRDF7_08215 [Candidatus Limnocylindrales bacterium]